MARMGCCDIYYYYHYYYCVMFIAWLIRAVPRKSSLRSVKYILISWNIQTYILYTNTLYLSLMCLWEMIFMCGGVQYGLHPSHYLDKPRFVMFVTLQLHGQCGLGLVLQKVPSELHPKVRNHGEGPY